MRCTAFCVVFGILITKTSAADYQQPPAHAGGAGSVGWIQTVAEDFQFSSLTPVATLTWWGGYLNPPTSPDNFSVRLFADSTGQPGLLLNDFVIGSVGRIATGDVLSGPIPEYRYSAALDTPFVAQPGVRYWLSIVNPPASSSSWLWEAAFSTSGESVQISRMGGPWEPLEDFGNFAFEIAAVPEPQSALLLATGVAGLLVHSWRIRARLRLRAPNETRIPLTD